MKINQKKMTNESKLSVSLIIVVLGISGLIGISIYKDHQFVQKNKETEQVIDSLKNELFVKDIVIGTYEVMWEKLVIEYPQIIEEIELEVE
jgi:hypothetical protein